MLTIYTLWRKFFGLAWRDRLLVLEALLWLAVAALIIAVLPFRYIERIASMSSLQKNELIQIDEKQRKAKRIRRAVITCARWVPWRAMCFQQGLAAQFMLRWRGFHPVLFYGVALDDHGELSAHVWVRAGNVEVVGCELASHYAVLTTVPSRGEDGD